ncbi:MAG: PEP/pyruvate-binding domain-containing protein [Anaerolineales bacterium]|nr:PEP/pyruvate-binding domain-containing protein [Anaerolineales bacterium]
MTLPSASSDRALSIYLTLAQYPILRMRIRARMRQELFARGIISAREFEAEVREKAMQSQAREGLHNPFQEETVNIWEMRLSRIRSHLTDFYFAYNMPHDLFEQIVKEVLAERGGQVDDLLVSFNPELAPEFMLFEQAQSLEQMEPSERERAAARLQEIKVVLIRRLISDQLAYINIAKEWFAVADLAEIKRRKIGEGKIGGKAAGMLLALRILNEVADDQIKASLDIPISYFVGSDVMYSFMAVNGLLHWGDQKYKPEEQIRTEYPQIVEDYLSGEFPIDILEELKMLLNDVSNQPLIVRSSSLLEDNFGTSFAGKYESIFCPNQGTPEQNLNDLTKAISKVYASVLNPDALLYRRSKGLQDYDERMGILIQVVQGERYGRYHLPHAAGVAFSRNLFRWSPSIRKEDGFMRLVWGLGTRAVERVGNDYPRLVALSHPLLHPESAPKEIRRYSQQYVDLIDLEDNAYKILPVSEVLDGDYPILRYLVEVDHGGYLLPLRSKLLSDDTSQLVLTFNEMLRRTPIADRFRKILNDLERIFRTPVDTEFTIRFTNPLEADSEVEIFLLQCRPQSRMQRKEARLPQHIALEDVILATKRMVPQGRVEEIRWVVFVTPEEYFELPTTDERAKVSQAIRHLNAALRDQTFICVGPGRWGTRNPDLGVYIGYADIYNTRSLVELAGPDIGAVPEPSFGTHFFQDLVEANIYPLAVYLDDEGADFNRDFFYNTPNRLDEVLGGVITTPKCLRLIEVASFRTGHHIDLIMDDERAQAVAFLAPDTEPKAYLLEDE